MVMSVSRRFVGPKIVLNFQVTAQKLVNNSFLVFHFGDMKMRSTKFDVKFSKKEIL